MIPSTQQYPDAQTGFQYLRARYYDPATGQFLTRDPIEAVTRSPYGYVGGNPLNAIDPSGLACWGLGCVAEAAVGAVGSAAGAVGGFVVDNRHTIIDVAATAGGAFVVGSLCVGTAGLGCVAAGLAGVAGAGVGAHVGSDAVFNDGNRISVANAAGRSVLSSATGGICGWAFGQGCGPAVLGRTSAVSRAELPFLARLVTRGDRAMNLGRGMSGFLWGELFAGKTLLGSAWDC